MVRFVIAAVASLSLLALTVAAAQHAGQQPQQIAQASADDQALPKGFKTTPVLKTTQTASKMKLDYPKTGQAEVVSVIGELEPGGRTARHQHPVPVFVYVLEGTITVQADGAEPRDYKAGQAFAEDINHWHQASNRTGAPAKACRGIPACRQPSPQSTLNAEPVDEITDCTRPYCRRSPVSPVGRGVRG